MEMTNPYFGAKCRINGCLLAHSGQENIADSIARKHANETAHVVELYRIETGHKPAKIAVISICPDKDCNHPADWHSLQGCIEPDCICGLNYHEAAMTGKELAVYFGMVIKDIV